MRNFEISLSGSLRLIASFTAAALLAGCAESIVPGVPIPRVPFIHRIDIQQGNVVTQEMVAQLRIGMNKKKVRFVMGTPIIQDTFHSSRWDYLYTLQEEGGSVERRLVTVIFNEDDKLINLEGDIKAALGRLEVDKHQDTSVAVPEAEKTLMGKLKDSMPFTGDDDEIADAKDKVDDAADDIEEAAEDGEELIAEADVESVAVPEGPAPKKKRGFFKRLVDSVGLGADEDDEEDEANASERDRTYRDPTNPNDE